MGYKILISYQTGDSFRSYDEEQYLETTWEDIDIAKENLQRIKEHYEWVQSHGRFSDGPLPIPRFIKPRNKKDKIVEHYKNPTHTQIQFEYEYYIPIKLDDGTEEICCAFWNGYFQTLYRAKIVSTEDDGWSFEV
jgi:ADP-dependent phosphofructokinase/glucokinase